MPYSIIKDIDVILEALTRNQYEQIMKDTSKATQKTYKDIRNVRNSPTFKQIFGNKQRIWKNVGIINSNVNILSLDRELMYDIFINMTRIYQYITETNTKNNVLDYGMYNRSNILANMWYDGYITINVDGKPVKYAIAKLLGTIRDKIIKHSTQYYPDITRAEADKKIAELNEIYKKFVARMDQLPENIAVNTSPSWICISRYPADVASMSTGQGWTSCLDLNNDNIHDAVIYDILNSHVKYEVAYGTCIAYLINEKEIKMSKNTAPSNPLFPLLKPKARTLIKPFYNEDGEVYLSIGTQPKVYPKNSAYADILTDYVDNLLITRQSNISGEFTMPDELYNDGFLRDANNTVVVENGRIDYSTNVV